MAATAWVSTRIPWFIRIEKGDRPHRRRGSAQGTPRLERVLDGSVDDLPVLALHVDRLTLKRYDDVRYENLQCELRRTFELLGLAA